ncbi:MAG: hypothetical protein M1832_000394 [Thelocarpon impressellum]|nr:MAG: hypothetical protein M1832_000394 [Thelocarpon impressellum]
MAWHLESRGVNGKGPGPIPLDPLLYSILPAMMAVAWYNCAEIWVQVFGLFKRRTGLYYYSLLLTTAGICINLIGAVLHYLTPDANWIVYSFFSVFGWIPMVVGQSLILYSRLHLVIRSHRLLRFVLLMIIVSFCAYCIPTSVLLFGSNSPAAESYGPRFNLVEKIQLCGILLLETWINALYIWATVKLLKPSFSVKVRRVMKFLIYSNIAIILLDIIVITMEFTDYYDVQGTMKPLIYSIKVKLEFGVLNQLMAVARRGLTSGGVGKGSHELYASAEPALDPRTTDSTAKEAGEVPDEQVGAETFGGNLMGSLLGQTVARGEVDNSAVPSAHQPGQPTKDSSQDVPASRDGRRAPPGLARDEGGPASAAAAAKRALEMRSRDDHGPAGPRHKHGPSGRGPSSDTDRPLPALPEQQRPDGERVQHRVGLTAQDQPVEATRAKGAVGQQDTAARHTRTHHASAEQAGRAAEREGGRAGGRDADVESGVDGSRDRLGETFARRRPSVRDFGQGASLRETADEHDEDFGLHEFEYDKRRDPNHSWFD